MALELNAPGDQIDHGDIAEFDGATQLTFCFWVKKSAVLTSDTPFIKKGDTWVYQSSQQTNSFAVGQTGVSEARTLGGVWPTNEWFQFGFLYNAATSPRLTLKRNGMSIDNVGTAP